MKPTHISSAIVNAFLLLILPAVFSGCGTDKKPKSVKTPKPVVAISPIKGPTDTILGDKVLSEHPLKIRHENFHWLIGMSDSIFQHPGVYDILPMDSATYLLQYDQEYLTSRRFFLIVRTKGGKIADYRLFNDHRAAKPVTVSDGYIILANCQAIPGFESKINHYLMILKLDRKLRETWRYAPEKSLKAVVGEKIVRDGDRLTCNVHINEASTIVYHSFSIQLDQKGQCIEAIETGGSNVRDTLDTELVRKVLDIRS